MIHEAGEVLATAGQRVRVACTSRRDCARCAAGRGCGGAVLGRLLGERSAEIEVTCSGPVPRAGERVVLEMHEATLLRAAALAYLAPLAGLVAGAVGGAALLGGDAAAMAGGLLGTGMAWLTASRHARRHAAALRPVLRRQ